jgi:YfiH family protein
VYDGGVSESTRTSERPLRIAQVPELTAVPGLVHGFEQRLGPAGWESRDEWRRRVASALATDGRLHVLHQVHGATVLEAPWTGRPEADGGVTAVPGVLLGIETADCLPVLLVDPVRRQVAAAHAGWRGTAQQIARVAVQALVDRGSRPADLLAALGPANGACCYEVGDELRAHFDARFFRPGPNGKAHLDVRAANEAQLRAAGVERIHHLADCTSCRPDHYHSYRREGRDGGRMVSYVGYKADGA